MASKTARRCSGSAALRAFEIGQRVENRGGLLYVDAPAVVARLLKLSDQRLDLLAL
jgi:hypothetical protein